MRVLFEFDGSMQILLRNCLILEMQGNLECARVLLEVGKANAHVQGKNKESTPLHLASLSGNADLVKLLLQYQV